MRRGALVWRAWTNPEVMVLWLGPVEWPAVSATQDLRVGGEWRACLRSPDTGQDLWQGGVYREIVPTSGWSSPSNGTSSMRTARRSTP